MRKLRILFVAVGLSIMGYSPTYGQVSLPDWPDTPEENLCRCKADGCYGGNLISFRARCGEGICSASDSNCPD